MSPIKVHPGQHFAYQLERLYWKATTQDQQSGEWRAEFGQLEQQIRDELSQAELAKLKRLSRAYDYLRKLVA